MECECGGRGADMIAISLLADKLYTRETQVLEGREYTYQKLPRFFFFYLAGRYARPISTRDQEYTRGNSGQHLQHGGAHMSLVTADHNLLVAWIWETLARQKEPRSDDQASFDYYLPSSFELTHAAKRFPESLRE